MHLDLFTGSEKNIFVPNVKPTMSSFWDRSRPAANVGFAAAPAAAAAPNGFGRKIQNIYDAPTYGQAFNEFVTASAHVRVARGTQRKGKEKEKNKK